MVSLRTSTTTTVQRSVTRFRWSGRVQVGSVTTDGRRLVWSASVYSNYKSSPILEKERGVPRCAFAFSKHMHSAGAGQPTRYRPTTGRCYVWYVDRGTVATFQSNPAYRQSHMISSVAPISPQLAESIMSGRLAPLERRRSEYLAREWSCRREAARSNPRMADYPICRSSAQFWRD